MHLTHKYPIVDWAAADKLNYRAGIRIAGL
jgi:hypothetical protein